jgi:hypothetical protein
VTPEPQARKQQVFSITSAAASQSEEISGRERRYAISMGIRTVCFIGCVVIVTTTSMPWSLFGWLLLVGALLLPYTSVILANAGVRKKGAGPSPFEAESAGELEPPTPPALPDA